jgi:hypothetical protein
MESSHVPTSLQNPKTPMIITLILSIINPKVDKYPRLWNMTKPQPIPIVMPPHWYGSNLYVYPISFVILGNLNKTSATTWILPSL